MAADLGCLLYQFNGTARGAAMADQGQAQFPIRRGSDNGQIPRPLLRAPGFGTTPGDLAAMVGIRFAAQVSCPSIIAE